ncbi:hypothetical protein JEZ13_02915 [bacterium]|nr:hypothetical protein [bacterium]
MENQNSQIVTVGDWIVTYLIMIVPLVNIIMLFVWAFGSNTPASKANWAKAALIWGLIMTIIYILFFAAFSAMLTDLM